MENMKKSKTEYMEPDFEIILLEAENVITEISDPEDWDPPIKGKTSFGVYSGSSSDNHWA